MTALRTALADILVSFGGGRLTGLLGSLQTKWGMQLLDDIATIIYALDALPTLFFCEHVCASLWMRLMNSWHCHIDPTCVHG